MSQGLVVTVTGPSGTGKNTVCQKLLESEKDLTYFVTATTREPRSFEKNGVDYHFLTKENFLDKLEEGEFVEWNEYHGNYYGTLKSVIKNMLIKGEEPISDITWSALSDEKVFPEIHCIALCASLAALDAEECKTDVKQALRTQKIKKKECV